MVLLYLCSRCLQLEDYIITPTQTERLYTGTVLKHQGLKRDPEKIQQDLTRHLTRVVLLLVILNIINLSVVTHVVIYYAKDVICELKCSSIIFF